MSWWNDFVNTATQVLSLGTVSSGPAPVDSWLNSTAGSLAAGIETGVVAFLKDLWDLILGPAEIGAGILVIYVTLGVALRGDVIGFFPGARRAVP